VNFASFLNSRLIASGVAVVKYNDKNDEGQ